ncbi:MAG: YraN family protein [Solirubrobacterales bacterium]|nr:YraN family protein [Solirubrobacterales bacterium]
MTHARLRLGAAAERLVRSRLERDGWRTVVTNARSRSGEIDLIVLDGTTLVFVEVKAGRLGGRAGPERPAHAVDRRKAARLRRLAREWLYSTPSRPRASGYRFDVVGVTYDGDRVADYEHIRGAF